MWEVGTGYPKIVPKCYMVLARIIEVRREKLKLSHSTPASPTNLLTTEFNFINVSYQLP
jgi:hypothetical protein